MESNKGKAIFSFNVDKVSICKHPPFTTTPEETIRNLTRVWGQFEDFSHRKDSQAQIIKEGVVPGILLAIHTSYKNHYPLKLSVSDFIILIGEGLGRHIENNSEELRGQFVSHQGKEKIEIRRDEFVRGKQNDWSTVFGDFAKEIKERVKTDIYDVIIDDTSVATPTSRIVSELTLMDAMKSYFDYQVTTICGIPNITLKGLPEDWQKLLDKVNKLVEMNEDDCLKLKWWLDVLVPTVQKICTDAINRNINTNFWSGIYKYEVPGSGSPEISGWITHFLPYLSYGPNLHFSSLTSDQIPKLVSQVPFKWNYLNQQIPMIFHGGFLGAKFDPEDFSLEPAYFWSVSYVEEDRDDLDKTKKKVKTK